MRLNGASNNATRASTGVGWRVCMLAFLAMTLVSAGAPILADTITVYDPDEPLIANTGGPDSGGGTAGSYDCERLILDDTDPDDLILRYDYFGTDVAIDNSGQIDDTLWLDKWKFDQDPDRTVTTGQGMLYDFRITWYGTPHEPGQPALNTVKLFGEWDLLWTGTDTIAGDVLTIRVPWDQFVNKAGTEEAFADETLLCFNFHAKVDNAGGDPDDLIPGSGYMVIVPEPATLLLVGGTLLGGLSLRRRRRHAA